MSHSRYLIKLLPDFLKAKGQGIPPHPSFPKVNQKSEVLIL